MTNIFHNINAICKDKRIKHSEFRVYMTLVSYNSFRKIFPSLDTISKDTGIKSITDISVMLNKLYKLDYIDIKRRKHQSNIYKILDVCNIPIKSPSLPAEPETTEPKKPKKEGVNKIEKKILDAVVKYYAGLHKRNYENGDYALINKLLKLKENDNYCYAVKCLMLYYVIKSVKDKINEPKFIGILYNCYDVATKDILKNVFKRPEINPIPNSSNIPFTKRKLNKN